MRETTGRNRPQVDAVKKFAADTHVDLKPMELDGASQVSVDKGAALASRAVAAQPERSRTLGPYAAPYQPLVATACCLSSLPLRRMGVIT
jgi:hypothetical protein